MDGNGSNNLDSWSIPKRKPQAPQNPPPPMDMAIPKKKKPPPQGPPPSMNMAIPRRPSVGGNPPPKKRPPFDKSSIPRKNSGSAFGGLNPSFDKAPVPRRPSFDPAEALLSMQQAPIPRKKHAPLPVHQPSAAAPAPPRPTRGEPQVVSEFPFIVKLPTRGVPMNEGIPRFRTYVRAPKRVRQNYKEVDEDDLDDFLIDSSSDDSDDDGHKPKKKKSKLKRVSRISPTPVSTSLASTGEPVVDETITAAANPVLGSTSLDAPPPGTLNTLWYSREVFLNIYVMEKVLAWKTRNVTALEWVPESLPEGGPPTPIPSIEAADGKKWSGMALTNPIIWADPNKRMEVSRLSPARCPIVATMACNVQSQEGPRYRIKATTGTEADREEVYLVKWRGRSHLHASWERGSDIIKFDQSNNTARHKIRRFVQSQEIAFGTEWKQVLEEERATTAAIHAHGEHTSAADTDAVEEEYYPPAHIEIERILACDESEMDMNLFAKQRGLNIKHEQERIRDKESGTIRHWDSKEGLEDLLQEKPWDPEDNVRYVVKWKGLPFAEITWEYWRDIKRDAVDEAEDFWLRQRPPDPDQVIRLVNKTHPHISEFRKLQKSPAYGISKRERPVANMGQAKEDDEGEISGFRLRSYQLEGVNWLLFNWWNRRSCILADEMGLGKTIQSMCFLKSLQDLPATEVRGPFLIVAPLSLIGQWQSEAKTWAPDLNVVLYHGSADARDFLVKQDFFYTDQFVPKPTAVKLKKQHITKFHILITTYEVVLKDVAVFSKIKWRALIVDEAHRLKNSKSKLFEDLGTVPRDFCLLLTGTPLANATEELWALLHFADKKAFADKEEFLEKFGELTDADQVNELHTILKPYLLRRVKEDVEKSLPPKEETILEVSLTPIQKKYYKAIYEKNTAFLYKGAKPNNAPSLMNVMMELRKCCNHPYLVRGAEERILADAASQITPENGAEGTPVPLDYGQLFGDQLIKSSGKMVLMHKLLPKLFSNGHKVLIFSQMVRVLDLLEELLKIMKYKYERLDGSTSSSSRASAVDRFCRKSCQRFVMLLSTRAGGLGLNLTAADVVVIFDSDWNPQNDLQAMARAHRIGQTRAVRVYRLLTAKTYEMHMFHSASMKLGLERAVLSQQRDQGDDGDPGKSKKSDREAQAKEIDFLLKKGAYDVFKEDDDDEAQKFMETDIDQLLESNAQTVTYGNTESISSGGLGSFSKASFVTDTGDGEKDVDLDDPDFWKKTAGLEAPVETPEDVAQMIDDGVKRSRKQVEVFDPFADYAIIEQRKEDKKMQKIREEKEEKEKERIEKRTKKIMEKERRRKEKKEMRGSLFGKDKAPISRPKPETKFKVKKKSVLPLPTSKKLPKESIVLKQAPPQEPKFKKPKRSGERKRAIKRLQNEDPEFERLKQAWDVPQRNRAISAFLRVGFPRFCKIRGEANFTSLPIQDIEVYCRSYFYQLSLQLGVSFLKMLKGDDAAFAFNEDNIKSFLRECLGVPGSKELDWLCDCVSNGMKYYLEIESQRRYFRLPRVFAEEGFVSDLRRGAALRALRRLFILSRVERIIADSLDDILTELGYEQLGRRGCPTSNFVSMDVDLKARLVSTEELLLGVSVNLKAVNLRSPVAWWDRSCDIALLVGTFVHGLGNYDAMLNDDSLPFAFKIKQFAEFDEACAAAQKSFSCAAKATSKVFHDALEAAKTKDQLQIQAAVAAAAAASLKREKDALALREGGEAADAVSTAVHDTPADKLYEIDGDDSHFVTLPRLKTMLSESVRSGQSSFLPETETSHLPRQVSSSDDVVATEEKSGRRKGNTQQALAMPDARILDYRLNFILSEVERNAYPEEGTAMDIDSPPISNGLWPHSEIVSINNSIKNRASSRVFGGAAEAFEVMGIGIHGMQAGSTHRTLDDGSDYFIGSANYDLSQIAYGSDAPRYLRAIGVPMNMTRFAVSALVHADQHCVESLLKGEKLRNMVDDEKIPPNKNAAVNEDQPSTEEKIPTDRKQISTSNTPVATDEAKEAADPHHDAPATTDEPAKKAENTGGAAADGTCEEAMIVADTARDTPGPATTDEATKLTELGNSVPSGATDEAKIAAHTAGDAPGPATTDEATKLTESGDAVAKGATDEAKIAAHTAGDAPGPATTDEATKLTESGDAVAKGATDEAKIAADTAGDARGPATADEATKPTESGGAVANGATDEAKIAADTAGDARGPATADEATKPTESGGAVANGATDEAKIAADTAGDARGPATTDEATKPTESSDIPVSTDESKKSAESLGTASSTNEAKQTPESGGAPATTDGAKKPAELGNPGTVMTKTKQAESADAINGYKHPPEIPSLSPQKAARSIPEAFEDKPKLRGSVCAVLLYYGFPFKEGEHMKISTPLWQSVREHCTSAEDAPPDSLFEPTRFVSLVKEFADDAVDPPDVDTIRQYISDCLLPHCLRLCLMGNGPTTDNARGSKGEYETAFGISLYPEPTENLQCGLPDPCLPLEEHSVEALATAYAILRRVQLMRSAMELVTGKLAMAKMDAVLRSSFMSKSMAGLPVWWCPWIHDAALLVHAATRGLFSIIHDRTSASTASLAFSPDAILKHIQSTFLSHDSKFLPRAFSHSSPEDLQKWIEHHAQDFPTANVLERRLAFLCSKASEHLPDDDARYDNLPMFDHGAWPRN